MMRHRSTAHQLPRGSAAVLALILLLCAIGCGEPEIDPTAGGFLVPDQSPASLQGRLYSGRQVLLLPGAGWRRYSRLDRWVLQPVSTLLCCVIKQPEQPLTIVIRSGGLDTSSAVELFWDDTLLERFDSSGVLRITIEPDLLQPGAHRLKLVRASGNMRLKGLRADIGNQTLLKGLGELERLAILNRLVECGVMHGPDCNELFGGIALYGPCTVPCPLPAGGGMTFTATLLNHSAGDALFRVGAGGSETVAVVSPGQKRAVTFPVPAGSETLTLAVEGEERGLFFWGEPWLEPERRRETTPLILITLDTTRRDAVSPFPGRETVTPVLHRFCGSAAVYPRALAVAPWTLPTHASIFTGLYPSRHGAGVRDITLDARLETLAEHLRRHGYFTAGFAGGPLASSRRGLAQGFCRYRDPDRVPIRGDRLTDLALACLDEAGDRPLFLFLNYFDAHAPYGAPQPFRQALGADRRRESLKVFPWWREIISGSVIDIAALERRGGPLPPEVPAALEAAYLAEVAFVDHQLGRLFEALRERDQFENALIVIVGDHGEFLGENGRFGHSCRLDPELTEIPLIVKRPNQREPYLSEKPVSQVDLYATILAAAGIEADPGDGVLLPGKGSGPEGAGSPILAEEHHLAAIHDISQLPNRVADHLYGSVDPERMVTVWEGGQEVRRWQDGGWQDAEGGTGWEETLRSIINRLSPTLPSPRDAGERLTEEEIHQLRLLGYLGDEPDEP